MTKLGFGATIKVDKGIPVSTKKNSGRHRIYPWLEMQVGDSFLFPSGAKGGSCHRSAHSANSAYPGRKFMTRKTDEGYRCWRIK